MLDFGNNVRVEYHSNHTAIYVGKTLIARVSLKTHKITLVDTSEKPDRVAKSIDSALSWAQVLHG